MNFINFNANVNGNYGLFNDFVRDSDLGESALSESSAQ